MKFAVDAKGALVEVWLPNRASTTESRDPLPPAALAGMRAAQAQLIEYFSGRRRTFDLLLEPRGSAFEQMVWNRLYSIPCGRMTTYGAIASELGLANGARAVGRANGANPIPIIIPCHRVIGTNGQLVGYGGDWR